MSQRHDIPAGRARRVAIACVAAVAVSVLMTWPLASNMTGLTRTSGDGLYSMWNVAWVAHALVTNPFGLFDANIFYPQPHALAYSEANIVAGIVAIPAWLVTGNGYAALNFAVIVAFATSALCMWLLVRRLTGDSAVAAVAAVLFAFCPYVFAHTAHIQLLFSGGIPLSLLALHRVVDAPSVGRGAWLGIALGVTALACAYYGIFAALMVGYSVLFYAVTRGLWADRQYLMAVATGAVVSIACVVPFFIPYLTIQDEGFGRTLAESATYSANAQSYVASSARTHFWMLQLDAVRQWPRFTDVVFPGFLALILGLTGLVLAFTNREARSTQRPYREIAVLYGSLGALAFWASFGPAAGLYAVLFRIPLFAFLRAPVRFGLIVVFALAVMASVGLMLMLARYSARTRASVAAALVIVGIAELNILPFPWQPALPQSSSYDVLAQMRPGPLAEFPFYGERPAFPLHTQYMAFSAAHWMPLLNGYSDHIPAEFRQEAPILASFPSRESFDVLRRRRIRYMGIHWDMYGGRAGDIRERLEPFLHHLRPIAGDSGMQLYEIVSFP
jgi:4-amino-4-deoxy-L-arabinose transferase-like glycosyltransferase